MEEEPRRSAVIVAEHPLWLEALDGLLHRVGVAVAGRATRFDLAAALVDRHSPDLLLADGDTADPSANWEHVRRIKERRPATAVVLIALETDDVTMDTAFAAGVDVYCTKAAEAEDVASAVRQLFAHSIYVPGRTRSNGDEAGEEEVVQAVAYKAGLTRREVEILRLVAEGLSNSQLAAMLWVTEQTVKFHLSNVYRKLGISNRTEASRWAQVHGLLPANTSRRSELPAA